MSSSLTQKDTLNEQQLFELLLQMMMSTRLQKLLQEDMEEDVMALITRQQSLCLQGII